MTTLSTPLLDPPARGVTRCAHCDQAVPVGAIIADSTDQFCCVGCKAVYETIQSCGLTSYYDLARTTGDELTPARPSSSSFAAYDSPTFHSLYVEPAPGGCVSIDLILEGVSCSACVWLLEKLPRVLQGVIDARLNLRQSTLHVTWNPAQLKLSAIARSLDRLGYPPHPAKGTSRKLVMKREERRRIIHLGAAGAIMGNTMLLGLALYAGLFGGMEAEYRQLFRWLSMGLGLLSLLWPGWTFFEGAIAAIRTRRMNLDLPIAMALAAGGIAGTLNTILNRGEIYFYSLTVLIFLLLVGRFLQFRQQRRADNSVELLFSMTPTSCRIVQENGEILESPIESLRVGDLVEIPASELVLADGVIQSGESSMNVSLLTGESAPVAVRPGDRVFGSAQNGSSPIRVRVEQTGAETRVGKLMRLVEQAVNTRPAIVQFADRVGAWFVVGVSIAAAGVFAYWSRYSVSAAIDHAIALLIVTCPCVLGLATPLTISVAIGQMARRHILIKSGQVLEQLAKDGTLFLDKTGTLTEGSLAVREWIGDCSTANQIAAIESYSNHPIARAIVASVDPSPADSWKQDELRQPTGESFSVSGVTEKNGGICGLINGREFRIGSPVHLRRSGASLARLDLERLRVERDGMTAVLAAKGGVVFAVIALGDRTRVDSQSALRELSESGFIPSILSGDAQGVVDAVAKTVGVPSDRAAGELSPEDKLARVRSAQQSGSFTVMVGDGVNDAAALAAADVGIAVHGGAEASLAAADVYIASPGLTPLVELAALARRTMRIVNRNLAISLAYNVLAGVLAAMGIMHPMIAAIIMPISSATVLSIAVTSVTRSGGKR